MDRRYSEPICECGDAFCAGCDEQGVDDYFYPAYEPTHTDDGGVIASTGEVFYPGD